MTKGKRKSQNGKSVSQDPKDDGLEALTPEALQDTDQERPADAESEEISGHLDETLEEIDQEQIGLEGMEESTQTLPSIEELQAEIEDLRREAEEYLDGWQRALAEFSNYKKRVEREQEEARARITGEILIRYLDVLDDFERALKDRPEDKQSESWLAGVELIYQKLKLILEAEGVAAIEAEGETFNPNFHEALSYEDSEDHRDGQVIEVLKKGYMLGERVIRPALVRVAK